MSEADAIREITDHINSGKKLVLGILDMDPILPILPGTYRVFYWLCSDGYVSLIKHPITLVRLISQEEAKANMPSWFEWDNPEKHPFRYYYEAVLD